MYQGSLNKLKESYFLPRFISLPDVIKIFSFYKKIPELSEVQFLQIAQEMDCSVFLCFVGWSWDIDLTINLITKMDSLDESNALTERAYDLFQESLKTIATERINTESIWGVFAEFYHIDHRFILDYVKNNIVYIRDSIISIDGGFRDGLIERLESELSLMININNSPLEKSDSGRLVIKKMPDDGFDWGVMIENFSPIGYENINSAFPVISDNGMGGGVAVSKDDLYIRRDDLLILLGLKEISDISDQQTNEKKNQQHMENKKNGISNDKHNAMTTARNIAASLWRTDQHREKRLSEMANEVWAELYRLGFADQLPEKLENMTNWIRTVAPEHARKAGRPPKTITPNLK